MSVSAGRKRRDTVVESRRGRRPEERRRGPTLSRRTFLVGGLALASSACARLGCRSDAETPLSYPHPDDPGTRGIPLAPTRACDHGEADPTRAGIEGPFYLPITPKRSVLAERDEEGQRLVVEGRVLGTRCQPVGGAVLELWHADARGEYDREGFGLRGHLHADRDGIFRVETVKPGSYRDGWVWRTPHLHVKVQGRYTRLLTTQLFFPSNAKENERDALFHRDLLLATTEGPDGVLRARFDFVLEAP